MKRERGLRRNRKLDSREAIKFYSQIKVLDPLHLSYSRYRRQKLLICCHLPRLLLASSERGQKGAFGILDMRSI